MTKRSPIVSVLGHVDHGKSSILDALRKTKITVGEAGGITQAIGASIMPMSVIRDRCGDMMDALNIKQDLPGLLFIDTPGHAAFTSLRKRGGALADIAILVVDINEGFQPQTIEAIQILRDKKTPFLIAANKVDRVPGFDRKSSNFIKNYKKQTKGVQQNIDNKLYEIVGSLYEEFQIESERYDRVDNFTKKIAIVPCSAITNVGLDELLLVLTGLSNKYLEKGLKLDSEGSAEGVIIEIKETKGLGKTLDTILYDGNLSVGDEIIVGTLDGPKKSKVRALLIPSGLQDMRDAKAGFKHVQQVYAATGVKVVLSNIPDNIISGMPLMSYADDAKEVKNKIKKQIDIDVVSLEKEGVVIKADTIGGLEALSNLLSEKNIPVRKASVGPVTKKDVLDAKSSLETNPKYAVVLGFNVPVNYRGEVKVIVHPIIYNIILDYESWQEELEEKMVEASVGSLARPAELKVLRNCVFRQSNPCILGVEVLRGKLSTNCKVMKSDGSKVSIVQNIQKNNEKIDVASSGDQVAISLPDATAGRQVSEDDVLMTDLDEFTFRNWKDNSKYLSEEEKAVIKDIARVKREQNSLWGV